MPVRRCTIQTVMVNALNMADRDSMGTIVSPFGVSCGFNVADLWICLRATPVRDYQPVAAVRLGMFSSDRISAPPFVRFLSLQQVPLLRDDQHGAELVRANLVKADPDAQLERAHQIESAPDEQTLLCALGGVQAVQRAVVAPLAIVLRRVGAQAGIAQFLPAQCPMHQEPKRRIIRPLPR